MNDFQKFVDELRHIHGLHAEIYYSTTMDWTIKIWKAGCARDYPKSMHDGEDAIMVWEQSSDLELACAKAHVALKQWLIDNEGGY